MKETIFTISTVSILAAGVAAYAYFMKKGDKVLQDLKRSIIERRKSQQQAEAES